MKLKFNLKEKLTEVAEHVYDVSKKDVVVDMDKSGVKVKHTRPTRHTIKWYAKNR